MTNVRTSSQLCLRFLLSRIVLHQIEHALQLLVRVYSHNFSVVRLEVYQVLAPLAFVVPHHSVVLVDEVGLSLQPHVVACFPQLEGHVVGQPFSSDRVVLHR